MKKVEFELSNSGYERWLQYKKEHDYESDSGALFELLDKTISDTLLLDEIYDAALCIIPINELTEEQKAILDNIQYHFCGCEVCETKAGHTNTKMYIIAIS